jgi:hypothetical protein
MVKCIIWKYDLVALALSNILWNREFHNRFHLKPSIVPYPESDASSPYNTILSFHLRLGLAAVSFPSVFQT